jgi:hypothetical protein
MLEAVLDAEPFIVRLFGVAEWASPGPRGLLNIGGLGVDQVAAPGPQSVLGPLFLVARLKVPWSRTTEAIPIRVRVLDADRQPVGQDPLADIRCEIGRPPGARAGDEMIWQFLGQLTGLPVPARGDLYFHLLVDDEPLAVLPLKILRPAAPAPAP